MKKGFCFLIFICAFQKGTQAQSEVKVSRFIELNSGVQNLFGMSDRPAELTKGIDSASFDYKGHLYAAYQRSFLNEISFAYQRNNFQLRGAIAAFSQKTGLKRNEVKSAVTPLATEQIAAFKLSALYRLAEREKNYPYGFLAGFNLSLMVPYRIQMDTALTADLYIRKQAQLNWGMDYIYSFALGKSGGYMNFAAALTFPGLLGSVGQIRNKDGSPYAVVEARLSTYSVRATVGIGFKLRGSGN